MKQKKDNIFFIHNLLNNTDKGLFYFHCFA
jgi:hypothetical protein